MAERKKIRLVRCPKCENLLPELPNLSVYQCGGCGIALQAKHQLSSDGSLEKSGEVSVRTSFEKLENFTERGGVVNLSDGEEKLVRERDGFELEKPINSNSRSSSKSENMKNLTENLESLKHDRKNVELGNGYGVKYRNPSKDQVDNWVDGNDIDKNRVGQFKHNIGVASESMRSGRIHDHRSRERDGMTPYRRIPRSVVEGVRLSTSLYPDKGPSNYNPTFSHEFDEPIKNQDNLGGLNRVEYLEQDQAELLRKLDELKDQLSRTCDVSDKPKGPLDPYLGRDTSSVGTMFGSNRADKHSHRRGHESVPLMSRCDMDIPNFYPSMIHPSNEIPLYGDPFGHQRLGRAPNQLHCPPHQSSPDYCSRRCMDIDPDYVASYPHNSFFYQPRCSCLNCYQAHPSVLCNRRFRDAPTNFVSYNLENPAMFGPLGYNPRDTNRSILRSFEPRPRERRQRTLDTETSGFNRGFLSSSEDEESPDSVTARREVSNSAELPRKENEHFECSSSDQSVSKFKKVKSKHGNQEEVVLTKVTSTQNSVNDALRATEMSHDSLETTREEDRLKISKGGGSFLVGLFKKSFRDDRSSVSINGQPIPKRLVKKAEKQAGSIHPGQYWYDFRAGFWGEMGQPCMGMIPPFIEEFNYPMPKNCAGGNTGVLVNGRELHQKDLDLLEKRGLPTTRDKSYIIEISGRVMDKDTGEELDCLGKLAPTVESMKHGFGMYMERADA